MEINLTSSTSSHFDLDTLKRPNEVVKSVSNWFIRDGFVLAGAVSAGVVASVAAPVVLGTALTTGVAGFVVMPFVVSLGGLVGQEAFAYLGGHVLHNGSEALFESFGKISNTKLAQAYTERWINSALMSMAIGGCALTLGAAAFKMSASSSAGVAFAGSTLKLLSGLVDKGFAKVETNSFSSALIKKIGVEYVEECFENFAGAIDPWLGHLVEVFDGTPQNKLSLSLFSKIPDLVAKTGTILLGTAPLGVAWAGDFEMSHTGYALLAGMVGYTMIGYSIVGRAVLMKLFPKLQCSLLLINPIIEEPKLIAPLTPQSAEISREIEPTKSPEVESEKTPLKVEMQTVCTAEQSGSLKEEFASRLAVSSAASATPITVSPPHYIKVKAAPTKPKPGLVPTLPTRPAAIPTVELEAFLADLKTKEWWNETHYEGIKDWLVVWRGREKSAQDFRKIGPEKGQPETTLMMLAAMAEFVQHASLDVLSACHPNISDHCTPGSGTGGGVGFFNDSGAPVYEGSYRSDVLDGACLLRRALVNRLLIEYETNPSVAVTDSFAEVARRVTDQLTIKNGRTATDSEYPRIPGYVIDALRKLQLKWEK